MNELKNLVSQGNLKIGKDTLIFNMNAAKFCPSEKLGLCPHAKICYAKKAEKMYPQVLPFRIRQANYWDNINAETFATEITEIINRKKADIKYLRISESGDFNSQSDIDKLSRIADLLKDICKVYTYTARKDLNFTGISNNLTVNGSDFMVNNAFIVTTNINKVNCIADCKKCNKCKVSKNRNIYVLKH